MSTFTRINFIYLFGQTIWATIVTNIDTFRFNEILFQITPLSFSWFSLEIVSYFMQ